ncbi:hypothetical protein FQA39_LY03593 [Lamprigera yunnana]|nr:hypothetical protein FQA39_LY03593 [Lamprigera yunnana]
MYVLNSIFVFLFICTYSECVPEECDRYGVLFYESMKCQPIMEPESNCPISYECPHLKERGNFCYYLGQKYHHGARMPQGFCSGRCLCSAQGAAGWTFKCSGFECPRPKGNMKRRNPNCYNLYDLEKCCSTGQKCASNVYTCGVEGSVYKEGQRFLPASSCKTCICKNGFNGTIDAPYCKLKTCNVELRNTVEIQSMCAPVYEKKPVRCCPFLWLCPSHSSPIITEGEPTIPGNFS